MATCMELFNFFSTPTLFLAHWASAEGICVFIFSFSICSKPQASAISDTKAPSALYITVTILDRSIYSPSIL